MRNRDNENLPKKLLPKTKRRKCNSNKKLQNAKSIKVRERNNQNFPKKMIPKTKKRKCNPPTSTKNQKLPTRLLFIQGPVKSKFNGIPYFMAR
tara:strand:- start:1625 stop:1903 length:279 start_codon:yes stop_codon:yes gene_type:complete